MRERDITAGMLFAHVAERFLPVTRVLSHLVGLRIELQLREHHQLPKRGDRPSPRNNNRSGTSPNPDQAAHARMGGGKFEAPVNLHMRSSMHLSVDEFTSFVMVCDPEGGGRMPQAQALCASPDSQAILIFAVAVGGRTPNVSGWGTPA
jgi:hypothetical protein